MALGLTLSAAGHADDRQLADELADDRQLADDRLAKKKKKEKKKDPPQKKRPPKGAP